MPDREQRRSRRGRRRERRERAAVPKAKPVEPLVNKLPLTEVLSEEGIKAIHRASMRLLKEIGILIVDYPPTLETFRANGARVEDNTVKIDEDTLMHFVQQAPSAFTQLARNSANTVPIGGRNAVFAPVYGPPYVGDLDRGRRQATLEDFKNFVKLTYMAPQLHHSGGTVVEPNDIPVSERHLDMLMAHITLSDKAFMGSVTHADNARDTVTVCILGKRAV